MASPKIPGGYILLSRKILDSEIMAKPPLYLKVWIYLLSRAQHRDYRGLKRGQLYTSIPEIQEAMSYMVGYRKEQPTYKQVRGVIDWLRFPHEGITKGTMKGTPKGNMIEVTRGTHGMLVTVVNYGLYQEAGNYERQSQKEYEGHSEGTTKDARRAIQGHNINKNVKNDKNDKKKEKGKYGDFVRLTKDEYAKLIDRLGKEKTSDYIDRLNNYIGSKGRRYKSHYHTVLAWVRRDEDKKPPKPKVDLDFAIGEENNANS